MTEQEDEELFQKVVARRKNCEVSRFRLTAKQLLGWLDDAERLVISRALEIDDAALAQLRELVNWELRMQMGIIRIPDKPDERLIDVEEPQSLIAIVMGMSIPSAWRRWREKRRMRARPDYEDISCNNVFRD